jgi:hypothetical protein
MTVLLGLVAAVSVVIVLTHVAEIYHAQWYIPLQLKSSALDRWLALAALIHTWSTLISYDTEPEFHTVRVLHCSLWSYWLQIFFGLQPWVLIMIFRVLQHGRDFHPAIRAWSRLRHRCTCALLTCVSAAPLLVVCILVPVAPDEDGKCHAAIEWKVPVMLWSSAALVFLAATGVEVYRKSPIVTRSGRALRDCVLAALVVLVAISAIHVIGFRENGLAIVPLVALLHLFVTLRCFAYTIWKAMSHDSAYVDSFFIKQGEHKHIDHRTTLTLDRDREAMEDFLSFANLMGREDLVLLYECTRDIVVAKRECHDTSEMWVDMTRKHPLALGAVLGTLADHVDAMPPEELYTHVLAHMHHVLGADFLRTERHYPEAPRFDSERGTSESSLTDGDLDYRPQHKPVTLSTFLDDSSATSSSSSAGEVIYAGLNDFEEAEKT